MKVVASFPANKLNQFIGMHEIICSLSFFRNISAQCNQAGYAPADVVIEQQLDLFARRTYAGYVRGNGCIILSELINCIQGAVTV